VTAMVTWWTKVVYYLSKIKLVHMRQKCFVSCRSRRVSGQAAKEARQEIMCQLVSQNWTRILSGAVVRSEVELYFNVDEDDRANGETCAGP
jgi:hypothetical protein